MNNPIVTQDIIVTLCLNIFQLQLHIKQIRSLAYAALGVMNADKLTVQGVGQGMARARGKKAKHCIKQVDRLLSNSKICFEGFFKAWVQWIIGPRKSIVVAMDWTEHDHDNHSTIAIYLITTHGRATPLVWKTVDKSNLKGNRNNFEDELLILLKESLPSDDLAVTVIADRGFGDQALYRFLYENLGFDYIIRFRGCIKVTLNDGEEGKAQDFLDSKGQGIRYDDVLLTWKKVKVKGFVSVKEPMMKDAWYIATSLENNAKEIVALYGKRFSIEETFRDIKDINFGLGMSFTHFRDPLRRDRLLMITAIAQVVLTLVGVSGELVGADKHLKANTKESRTHSLFRQGREYLRNTVMALKNDIKSAFIELLNLHLHNTEIYGFI